MEPLGIALLGCGVVGSEVARVLLDTPNRIAERAGRAIQLRHVLVRDRHKRRSVSIPDAVLTTDFRRIVDDHQVGVAVELMGGIEPARSYCLQLLETGRDLVTANKAVLAHHGDELFSAARRSRRAIGFEASVAAGVPILAALSHSLAANDITSVKAIVNGTCNFILTQMTEQGQSYAEALAEAQRLGYAEADPTLDVDGTDSCHKLAILARVAFGTSVEPEAIERRGIDWLQPADLRFASELGYVVKLVAEAWVEADQLALHVEPTLVRRLDPLGQIRGPYNAIHVVGDLVQDALFSGLGAGRQPTASAVLADLIPIVAGRARAENLDFDAGRRCSRLRLRSPASIGSRFYLRITAEDRPGVLAEVAGVLARHHISIASVMQHEALDEQEGSPVPVVIMTHTARLGDFRRAVALIDQLDCITAASVYFPVAE